MLFYAYGIYETKVEVNVFLKEVEKKEVIMLELVSIPKFGNYDIM